MENLEAKLDELEELLKSNLIPSLMPKIKTPNANGRPKGPGMPRNSFKAPKTPGINPSSSKNPVKIAEQITNPDLKEDRIKQAKEGLSLNSRGQWSLK
jgi:hypothetical protein